MVVDLGSDTIGIGLAVLGAGIAFAGASLGTSLGQGRASMAAIGAIAENEELFGKTLIFTVIPETGTIFAFVVVVMILQALGLLG